MSTNNCRTLSVIISRSSKLRVTNTPKVLQHIIIIQIVSISLLHLIYGSVAGSKGARDPCNSMLVAREVHDVEAE